MCVGGWDVDKVSLSLVLHHLVDLRGQLLEVLAHSCQLLVLPDDFDVFTLHLVWVSHDKSLRR